MFSLTAREAGWSGLIGGLVWALTPLRQPVFDAGRTPDEGETFFRLYNLVLIIVAILLTVALLRLRDSARPAGKTAARGWWIILAGHSLLVIGSSPAVLFGDEAATVVMVGQDLGFLGAVVAALGALLVGLDTLRRGRLPRLASWLLLLTLPLGVAATAVLAAIGTPEDYLGLPLTVLYGGSWIVLGWCWIREGEAASTPPSASAVG